RHHLPILRHRYLRSKVGSRRFNSSRTGTLILHATDCSAFTASTWAFMLPSRKARLMRAISLGWGQLRTNGAKTRVRSSQYPPSRQSVQGFGGSVQGTKDGFDHRRRSRNCMARASPPVLIHSSCGTLSFRGLSLLCALAAL